jgi:hypothetical protein
MGGEVAERGGEDMNGDAGKGPFAAGAGEPGVGPNGPALLVRLGGAAGDAGARAAGPGWGTGDPALPVRLGSAAGAAGARAAGPGWGTGDPALPVRLDGAPVAAGTGAGAEGAGCSSSRDCLLRWFDSPAVGLEGSSSPFT